MNNYDDIKRFKEKLNIETIDYKEIAENNPNSSASSWTIIKQIVNADKPFHPLEQGHSTLPAPALISQQEFSARPAASDVAPAPLPSANAAAGPSYGPRSYRRSLTRWKKPCRRSRPPAHRPCAP